MASTSLVDAVCERIIEKLQKENPDIEYRKKVAKCATPKKQKKGTISKKSQREILKKAKKPILLN